MSFLTFGAIGLLLEWVEVLGEVGRFGGRWSMKGQTCQDFLGRNAVMQERAHFPSRVL